jgi:uncharacterized protein YidB (DUF937 family)
MGFMDILTQVTNSIGKEKGLNPGMLNGILDMFKSGGLRGLIDQFAGSGLEDIVKSWVGKGGNMPVSADQLKKALGPDMLSQLADKAGVPVDKVPGLLKNVLPDIIDKVTPNGKVEDD